MQETVLSDRLQALGWTHYRLAKELSALRGEGKAPARYVSAVSRAVNSPDTAKLETFRQLVEAMGGEVVVRWPKTKTIVQGYEEV